MPIRLVVSMTAAPGKGDELAAAFSPVCVDVQKEPGCQQYELFQSRENPDNFVLIEKWADEVTLGDHSAAMRARNFSLGALRTAFALERYPMQG